MRLIDADKIRTNIVWMKTANEMFKAEIDRQPTVEAEPVKEARWAHKPMAVRNPFGRNCFCTACGFEPFECLKFCPNCGAKIIGEEF